MARSMKDGDVKVMAKGQSDSKAQASPLQSVVGVLVGALVTPVTLSLAFASAAGGHGHYYLFAFLYPMVFLVMRRLGYALGMTAITLLMCLQFPAYGSMIGAFKDWRIKVLVTSLIAVGHSLAIYLCFYVK